MRILYGVTGEGLGHTMRARVLVQHLVACGHRVKVAASGRASAILERHGLDVLPIEGLKLVYRKGALERVATAAANARDAPAALRRNLRALAEAARFDPHAVVTDFDSFSYALGRLLELPIVSIDHQHVLSRFAHPRAVLDRLSYDFPLALGVVERKLPRCARYIVSSFYFPAVRSECAPSTRLVGPVVRPELAALAPRAGEHVLVYQTGSGDPGLVRELGRVRGARFRLYGPRAQAAPNVEHRPFSEAGFLADLASARAVIANGGYTTLSEAVCLGKPVLSIPIRHQGEQELNAAYLEHDGLGALHPRPQARAIAAWLDGVARRVSPPRIAAANDQAAGALDQALAEVA